MGRAIDLTADLKEVALLATEPAAVEELLPRALDFLSDVIPYDLASVLELSDDALKVRCARGRLADDRVRAHSIALANFPSVRHALETRRTRVMQEDDHAHEGDPYDGVLDLQHGHACMVVPLFSGDRTLGALTFDQAQCGVYEPSMVNLATICGQIIALAMVAAEHAALLDRQRRRLKEENRLLVSEVTGTSNSGELMERSKNAAMQKLTQMARQVADTDAPVLINGETGTGKEVLARAIHGWSARRSGPFVKLNSAALPDNLVESELFGHAKGAFTGADRDRPGRFTVANGGTLLLDEIGDLPLEAQSKLLRVLQEGTFEPVGSDRTIKVDVRIVAATHVDLEKAIQEGRFREDLFYRLNVFPLEVPPLRDRPEDIAAIANDCLADLARRTGGGPWSLSKKAEERLPTYDWPGNVRELLNHLERATILSKDKSLEVEPPTGKKASKKSSGKRESWPTLSELERDYIEEVLELTSGKIYGTGGAAERLDLKPSTLQSRMSKLGIKRK